MFRCEFVLLIHYNQKKDKKKNPHHMGEGLGLLVSCSLVLSLTVRGELGRGLGRVLSPLSLIGF